MLKVVLKNLADPVKSQDQKYRQLKLENDKVRAKILPCPSSMDYLKAIGFKEATDGGGENILRIESVDDLVLMKASLQEVSNGLDMVSPKDQHEAGKVLKKHRTEDLNFADEKKEEIAKAKCVVVEQLTGKQIERLLTERKAQQEREVAKAQRKKVAKLIQQDKYVRANDENWVSAPSSACAKTGSTIVTFRDRHGENDE